MKCKECGNPMKLTKIGPLETVYVCLTCGNTKPYEGELNEQ
jgi:hypothetical protein